uniref:THAP-type domain-containing protein n=1 Tax=Poecilia reticulata TaxID=8081 RepID=A0A3P9P0R0_POERE
TVFCCCCYSCKFHFKHINSLNKFSKEFTFLKKWLSNMKLKDWAPTRFSALCINHFEERHIDRTGKCVTLRDDAVPTIFSPHDKTQKNKVYKDQKNTEKWRIIVDERLRKIDSFPHFFHGDYCLLFPTRLHVTLWFQVKGAWQWLGLDVRGSLPQTLNGHRYILTLTDFYSRWVEAVPMQSCLPSDVAKSLADIIAHFGYPLRILSRLPHDINCELKDHLKDSTALVVYHQQTGSVDLITPQLIDSDLTEEHAADWDVYLPAKVFGLCFKQHSVTKERPFTLLCCNGLEPIKSPRGLDVR